MTQKAKFGWSVVLKGMNKGKVYKRDCIEPLAHIPVFNTEKEAKNHAWVMSMCGPMSDWDLAQAALRIEAKAEEIFYNEVYDHNGASKQEEEDFWQRVKEDGK